MGVTRAPSKRLSRSRSGAPSAAKAALRAAASTSASSLPRTPSPHQQTQTPVFSHPVPSNPIAHTAASGPASRADLELDRPADRPVSSIAARFSPSKAVFAAAARGLASDVASSTMSRIRRAASSSVLPSPSAPTSVSPSVNVPMEPMDIDIDVSADPGTAHVATPSMSAVPSESVDQPELSSSSLDARMASRATRGKITPDAKRAQNRESAKRFRVAQKKRWAELLETVAEKDAEIERLKGMLQEITSSTLTTMRRETGAADLSTNPTPLASGAPSTSSAPKIDSLTVAELDLFVKLLRPQEGEGAEIPSSSDTEGSPPLAADIGSLHRVLVSRLDGSVLGVRHESRRNGAALGGDVGGLLWEHVHSSDSAHLRASVVHAKTMLQVMGGQPSVFSYRRRRRSNNVDDHSVPRAGKDAYIRMKGCLYPLVDDDGEVTQVILAEFIEI